MTRGGELGPVLAGVHAALDAGLRVKVNAVGLGGMPGLSLEAGEPGQACPRRECWHSERSQPSPSNVVAA